jgi:hypothetical protein
LRGSRRRDQGRPAGTHGQRGETIEHLAVSAGYVATLVIRTIEGRDLDDTGRKGASLVVLVNETMARRDRPGERTPAWRRRW